MLACMNERVQFSSAGLKLAGLLHLPADYRKGERRPAFLVMHGFGSRKDSEGMRIAADLYASLGYVALRFDFRGCGESEGARGRVICLEQVEDARAALAFLMDRPEIDAKRVGVIQRVRYSRVELSRVPFIAVGACITEFHTDTIWRAHGL